MRFKIAIHPLPGRGKILCAHFLFLFFFYVPFQTAGEQLSFTETIQQTARFQNAASPENTLRVYNINGSVTIEGADRDEIEITAEKTIEAHRRRDVEKGKEEIRLAVEEEGDRILVYMDAPFIKVKKRGDGISFHTHSKDIDYSFHFNITIKVPRQAVVHASTVNKGDVTVQNVTGTELKAANVNGNVELIHVMGKTEAHTVNGDIRASYAQSPDADAVYKTINGTIEVSCPDDLSADIRFKSMHGDLYTDFENIQHLNARVETSRDNRRGGTTYRIDRFSPIRIGEGGPEFRFDTLNGDVYIKRNKI